jgi:hypothetical protein
MGKRELLLIVGFALAGIVLYQLTAPARPSGSGFSLGRLIQSVRREVAGNRARAERTTQTTEALSPEIDEVRVQNVTSVTLVGENRDDLQIDLTVSSTGADDREAAQLAEATRARLDTGGRLATLSVEYPEGGQQRAAMTVHMPFALRARIEAARTETRASDIGAVYLDGTRGRVSLQRIHGLIEGTHVGGEVEMSEVGAVKLTTRSADVRIGHAQGEVRIDMTGGTLTGDALAADFQFDGRGEVEITGIGGTARLNTRSGRVSLRDIRHEVRFDGRDTDFALTLAEPAPVTAVTSGADIDCDLPEHGGYTLDLAATDGRVRVSNLDLPVTTEGTTERAGGKVHGGGPVVALRATDGSIEVRVSAAPSR